MRRIEKKHKWKIYHLMCFPAFFLLLLFSAKAYGAESVLPPLIQTTTFESDYRAAALLGLTGTRILDQEDSQQAFDNVLSSCVRIQVEGHYGSGSIYRMLENEIIIATNRHVLQYWDEDSYVTFFDGISQPGELIGVSDEADIGFLSVPAAAFSWEELLRYRSIRSRQEEVFETLDFFIPDVAADPGHPVMEVGEILSPLVYLEDFGREMLYGKGWAVPGMSGGGVFDGYGNYLGMLTGGTLEGEIAAVPAQTVYDEYVRLCFEH